MKMLASRHQGDESDRFPLSIWLYRMDSLYRMVKIIHPDFRYLQLSPEYLE